MFWLKKVQYLYRRPPLTTSPVRHKYFAPKKELQYPHRNPHLTLLSLNTVVNNQEGRYENSTPEDMAVGLLLTRKARNNLPAFTEIAGKTLMKGIEVRQSEPVFEFWTQTLLYYVVGRTH